MKLNLLSASLLSLVFIILAAIISIVVVNAKGIVELPDIQPQVASLLLAGIGVILVSIILYSRQ